MSEYQTREEPEAVKGANVPPSFIVILVPVIGAFGVAFMVKVTATGKLFKLLTVCVT